MAKTHRASNSTIKPFLLTLLPLLLCLYGWLCVLSHKNKILFYMTSNE